MDSKKAEHKQPVDATRRRLLKASAAAPLIASLAPSTAMAMSSAAQCAGGDFSNKKFAENGNSLYGDTAVRIEVPYFKKTKPNKSVKHLANDLYDINGRFFHNSGKEYWPSDEALSMHYDKTTAYVLELFDISDGQAVSVGVWPQVQVNDLTATPLTGSCWTSLDPTGLDKYI